MRRITEELLDKIAFAVTAVVVVVIVVFAALTMRGALDDIMGR